MAIRQRSALTNGLGELRYEPTAKRIRAAAGGATVVDSTRAVLVWEPRRVVPSYAVPAADVRGDLIPATASADTAEGVGYAMPDVSRRPVLDPSIPFGVHSAAGDPLDLAAGGAALPGAAFRPADPDLDGYVVLDFAAFDGWQQEDEPNIGHPQDPFHRIDVLASSRSVRLELDGELLADSTRPVLLFETMLPTRYYLPRADVRVELRASPTASRCAYKGEASYWSPVLADRVVPDLAWSYPAPLHDAAGVADLIAFFDERVDVTLDGVRLDRPVTPWSAPRPG